MQANPKYGYHFDHWSDGSTENPYTLTVTNDMTLTAYFARNRYTLTANANNDDWGSASFPQGPTALYMDTLMVVAQPAPHYHATGWSGDGIIVTSADNDTAWVKMTADRTVTCTYAIDRHNIAVEVDDVAHGTVEGGGVFDYGAPCTVEASAYTGYHFDHWSNGVEENPYAFAVQEDMTLTAVFARNTYTLTANTNNAEWGTADFPNGETALYMDTLMVVAHPAPHYHATGWSGSGIVSTSADHDTAWVKMTADRIVTCNYAIDTHSVTVTTSDMVRGMVTGGGMYEYGSPCTVEATPYTGYVFAGWSNGVKATPYVFAVMEDVELTAIFLTPEEAAVGINDVVDGTADLRVYAEGGSIHVSLNGTAPDAFSVYDIMGRPIVRIAGSDRTAPLPAGIYMVRLGTLPAKKVVVIR